MGVYSESLVAINFEDMEKLNQKLFFKRYSISEEDFEKANLIWEDLNNIHNDFLSQNNILEETGTYISNNLMKLRRVHSVRFRVKNPSHLIEKIIRKKSRILTASFLLIITWKI